MSKPLTDWTLRETKEYCQISKCEDCSFANKTRSKCSLALNPCYWKLQCERFTNEEKERAKAILTIYPEATTIAEADYCIRIFNKDKILGYIISIDLFPTLEPGEVIEIADIT